MNPRGKDYEQVEEMKKFNLKLKQPRQPVEKCKQADQQKNKNLFSEWLKTEKEDHEQHR